MKKGLAPRSFLDLRSFSEGGSEVGFTLMELLIVIGLLAIVGAAMLVLLNPLKQIQKSWDGKRKGELGTFRKIFEDYYNDKQCYPQPNEVCYNPSAIPIGDGTYVCNICGNETVPPSFANLLPYMPKLPCDPQHATKKYLYQVDQTACPKLYKIYSVLSNVPDFASIAVGCQYGCGPYETYTYNYFVGSPNTSAESNPYLCSLMGNLRAGPPEICNTCGSYSDCKTNYPGKTYYIIKPGFPDCTIPCIKD